MAAEYAYFPFEQSVFVTQDKMRVAQWGLSMGGGVIAWFKEEQEAMAFLAELRVVFSKYTAGAKCY